MRDFTTTREAARHLMRGQMALSEIEGNGIRIDRAYLDKAIEDVEAEIADAAAALQSKKEWRAWKKTFGDKANLGSREQLGTVVFDELGYESGERTATGRHRADKSSLERVDIPFVQKYLDMEELKKGKSTFLEGIRNEMVCRDGYWFVHPSFNLNMTKSYRSSSDRPNFQAQPVRSKRLAEMVRRCYIPRRGRYFGEVDEAQIEVRVAACYTKDPALLRYINDKSTDMHRDTACDIFKLPPEKVVKEARHAAKNQFVFPQFYGSAAFQCAPHLWEAMERRKLTAGEGGPPIRKHLAKLGIKELGDCAPDADPRRGTFVHHLRGVERALWKRFAVYDRWKREWYAKYQREGGFRSFVGFGWSGPYRKNEVLNYVVQCDAFQVTLWSLTKLVPWLRKYKMKTLILGEIHDSIQVDVPSKELDDVLSKFRRVMTEDVRKHWDWIITPLEVEAEVSPVGKSWYEKSVWTESKGGRWQPKR